MTNNDLKTHFESLEKEIWDLMISDNSWTDFTSNDGIKVQTRTLPNFPIHLVRSRGEVNASPDVIRNIFLDSEGRKKWDEVIMDLEIIHSVNEDCLFIYESYKVPFPIVARDILYVRRCTKTKEEGGYFFHARSINPHDKMFEMEIETNPKSVEKLRHIDSLSKSRIRADLMEWGYLVQPVKDKPNFCECTYMIQMDPKGWIPNWLINKLTKNGSNYVQQIRKLVKKETQVV